MDLRREQTADREADINGAAGLIGLDQLDPILDDGFSRDGIWAAAWAVFLTAEIPHERAMAGFSQSRADFRFPSAGIAGERVEKDDVTPSSASGGA